MKKIGLLIAFVFCSINIFAQADIKVMNSDYKANYIQGGTNTYSITVVNVGPNVATNVNISNPIPNGINSFSWSGGPNGATGANKPLNDVIASMGVGVVATYTIVIQVPTTYSTPLISVTNVTSSTADPNPSNNQNITDTDVLANTNIMVTNTDGIVKYTPGTTNTYTLTVQNQGPNAATNVSVSDVFPAGLTVTWSGNGNTNKPGPISDVIANLPAASSVTYTVTVNIPVGFTGDLKSDANATFSGVVVQAVDIDVQDNPNPQNADIVATKTDNKSTFLYNSSNTYTIVVTNKGPNSATNVVVSDPKPLGITDMTWFGSNGSNGSGDLQDVIPALAVGDVVVYTVTIQIPATYAPVNPTDPTQTIKNITNSVKLTSDSIDPVPNCPGCIDVDNPAADYVTIDTTKYTAQQLVSEVLINSPCVTISNFTSSTNCGFGYFNKANSSFPIKEGMVIRSGDAKKTEGKWDNVSFNNNNTSTECSKTSDPDLTAIMQAAGINGSFLDCSFVKFNFVAGGDNFSFRYLFASNEYGTYQCGFTDAFAFILTDITAGTAAKNLALIPGTNIPVSVTTIRNTKYNGSCVSAHPELFAQFNPNNPTSAIKMQGQTVIMTASAPVIAGHTYSIKMVIGDYLDTAFDSAVFVEAGSFDLGNPNPVGTGEYEGLTDIALCSGATTTLQSGKNPLPNVIYSWRRNGVLLPGENKHTLDINQDGVYTVTYTYNTGCEQSADILVTYTSGASYEEPNDLSICNFPGSTFDLTVNEPVVLGGQNASNYLITYYHSQTDAENGNPGQNPINNTNKRSYNGTDGEEVFMRIELASQNCYEVKSFKLFRNPAPFALIAYADDGGEPGFCRGSYNSYPVTKSNPFTEGGTYAVTDVNGQPTTGLTVDPVTGSLDFSNAVPGDYVVTYILPPNGGCDYYEVITNVKVAACISVTMNPIASVCPGDSVVLTCTDAGVGVTYNWYDENKNLLATTTVPSYTLPSSPTTAGNYIYSVSGTLGTDESVLSSKTLVVNPIPVVSITGTTSVCEAGTAVVAFMGTPGAFVTYDDGVNGPATVQLSNSGTVGIYELTTPSLNSDITYQLVSVEGNYTPSCVQNIPNTAPNSSVTISVISAPTASVSFGGASTICENQGTDIVFEGTPGAIVAYTKKGQPLNVTLSASGQPTVVNTGVLIEDTEYKIVSVTSSGAACVGYPDSSIIVDVVNIPKPALKQKAYVCLDPVSGATTRPYTLETGLDTATYDFVWYQDDVEIPGATQNSYEANTVAQYKVLVTDKVSGCTRTAVTDVLASLPPTGVSAEVSTAYFSDNATVEVTATPSGNYEYSLDFGPFQDSNIFEGVSSGTHQISVRDKEACAVLTTTVTVIDFPRFFTPNSDGYNDTWNISSLNSEEIAQPNAKIYIFDRYGKLLKQITPSGAGWDGTYNGQAMPADDYWFIVEFEEQSVNKEFKSHFSLKR